MNIKKSLDNNMEYIKVDKIEDVQRLLYLLVNKFHCLCEKHDLRYSLYFGSLIGAVRHSGIIPWDDDIDIVMPRPDYNQMVQIINHQDSEELIAYDFLNNTSYGYPFVKVGLKDTFLIEEDLLKKYSLTSLYIDIFPMDAVPPISIKRKSYKYLEKKRREHDFYLTKITLSPVWWKKPFVVIRLARRLVLFLLGGLKKINIQTDAEIRKYDYGSSSIVTYRNTSERCALKYEIDKKEFNRRHLVAFGPIQCWIFDDYNHILTNIFGDYMTPPQKEKQKRTHNYSLYIKRNSPQLIQCIDTFSS